MAKTGGEPDVVDHDQKTGEFIFVDCCAESPAGLSKTMAFDRLKGIHGLLQIVWSAGGPQAESQCSTASERSQSFVNSWRAVESSAGLDAKMTIQQGSKFVWIQLICGNANDGNTVLE